MHHGRFRTASSARVAKHFKEDRRSPVVHIYFGQIAVHLLPLIRGWKQTGHRFVSPAADVTVDMNKPAYREATRPNARRSQASPGSLRFAAARSHWPGLRREKDRDPANRDSAG